MGGSQFRQWFLRDHSIAEGNCDRSYVNRYADLSTRCSLTPINLPPPTKLPRPDPRPVE